ncbi:hypothetical protein HDU78_000353 [Chytriomyces hyalinus]|nr:hypothetical protein HDU78_000353 [Chytriomyces hyalinus]KAJ3250866.1 hypothetical protein HDU77_006288 [Chytriomyces hyalinus]
MTSANQQCNDLVTFNQCLTNFNSGGGVTQCQIQAPNSLAQNKCLCQQYWMQAFCYSTFCPQDMLTGSTVASRDTYCALVPGFNPATGFAPSGTVAAAPVLTTATGLPAAAGTNNPPGGPTLQLPGANISPTALPKGSSSEHASPVMALAALVAIWMRLF